jgi:hypothetical protein
LTNLTALYLIIVSDELEQSANKEVSVWLNDFISIFKGGKKNILKFFTIINKAYDSTKRFQELANSTGGPYLEIRDLTKNAQVASGLLEHISLSITDLLDSFVLNFKGKLIPESVVVKINGQELSSQNWQLLQNNTMIKLNNPPYLVKNRNQNTTSSHPYIFF